MNEPHQRKRAPAVHPVIMNNTVAARCGLKGQCDIIGDKRSKDIVFARAILAYIYRHREKYSLVEIQQIMCYKGHHAVTNLLNAARLGQHEATAKEINPNCESFKDFADMAYTSAVNQTRRLPSHRWPPKKIEEKEPESGSD